MRINSDGLQFYNIYIKCKLIKEIVFVVTTKVFYKEKTWHMTIKINNAMPSALH